MKYTVLTPIRHNGSRYEVGSDIDIEEQFVTGLLMIDAIAELNSSTKDKPKGGNLNPSKPSKPQEPKVYAEMSNKEQIAFFENVSDKTELESFLADSKAKAKLALEKKLKELI